MGVHYTYFTPFIEDENWQKFVLAAVLGTLLVALGRQLARKLNTPERLKDLVVPNDRLTLFGFVDFMVQKFVEYQDSILGAENRRYVPFTGTVFFFIFFSNLLGLIPGMPAITTTVWVNLGIALVVFFYFNYHGIRENGFIGYMKHFCGPIAVIAPAVFLLEWLSTILRVFTLNLRLYWNITADHLIVGLFTDLVGYVVPALFYAMGLIVAFMQAFVFTTLTMIYILLATQHGEEEH